MNELKIYGGICLCNRKIYFSSSWKEFKKITDKEKCIFRKGEKKDLSKWINYCKNSIYKQDDIDKLKENEYIFCDAGTKNKRLEVRVTDNNSNSFVNKICNNNVVQGNYVLDEQQNYSVNYAELLGIFFSLLYCKQNKHINFIFSDSSLCVFFWLCGIYKSNINKYTKDLIQKTRKLLNEISNVKVSYISRTLNKSDISLGIEKNKRCGN